ncbi:MAG TPA: hypothetical protein VGY77_04385, partial [Gemmataceae bacterium]|nr:hypothetical protein [Gemmataceae bacterium]
MAQSPKRKPILIALVLSLGLITGILIWVPGKTGFATPHDCLCSYYETCQCGEPAGFLDCLGEPLRSETERRWAGTQGAAETLRSQAVKNWVLDGSWVTVGKAAHAEVEEIRAANIQRVRFRLEQSRKG